MNIKEFEQQFKASLATTLEHLQAINLLTQELEAQKVEAGESLQTLSRLVEEFLAQEQERPISS